MTATSAPSASRFDGMVRVAVWVAAAVSLGLTVYTGRHNPSLLLVAMFAVWVASPFAGFLFALRSASRAASGIASAMRASILVLAVGSTLVYALAASFPLKHAAAFPFLAVPAVSWLALGTLLLAARLGGRR